MDLDFPRGKVEISTVQVKKSKQNVSSALSADNGNISQRTSGKRIAEANSTSATTKKAKFVNDKFDAVWTHNLNAKTVSPNLLAVGCLSAIFDHELKVELADGVTVTVPSSAISQSGLSNENLVKSPNLHGLYTVGQLLVVKIVHCDVAQKNATSKSSRAKKRFMATLDPKQINQHLLLTKLKAGQVVMASVKSVEEKGFILDLGSATVFGFLPFDKCNSNVDKQAVGYSFLCAVDTAPDDKSRVIRLTCKISEDEISTLSYRKNQLLPGTRVEGTIEKITNLGAYLALNKEATTNQCYAFISKNKLPKKFQTGKEYEVGTQMRCTVTYLCPNSNMVGFSAENHLNGKKASDFFHLKPEQLFRNYEIGQKCKSLCKAISFKRSGVYFQLDCDKDQSKSQPLYGFCHAEHLEHVNSTCGTDGDKRADLINRDKYVPDQTRHTLRITGRSFMGRLLYVSDSKSIMQQSLVDVEHAKPGTLVENVKIIKIDKNGLRVKLFDKINGFIPDIFLDRSRGKIKKKYEVGKVITCRVLTAEAHKNRVILTARKAQVKSTQDAGSFLDAFDNKFVGSIHQGVIVHATDSGFGLLLAFYNNVKGFLNLAAEENFPKENFSVGQIATVRVDKVDEMHKKMQLSLAASTVESSTVDDELTNLNELPENSSISTDLSTDEEPFYVKVVGVTKRGLRVVGDSSHKFTAVLPSYHLTDNNAGFDLLAATYKIGDRIGPCVVFSRGSFITVSAKPLLVKSVVEKTNPITFDQLEEHGLVAGVISKVHPDLGYFIDLPGGQLTGLAGFGNVDGDSSDNAPDNTKTNGSSLVIGQTVVGRIQKIDLEKHRFRLSLRVTDCIYRPTTSFSNADILSESICLLKASLIEQSRILIWAKTELPESDPRRFLTTDDMAVGQIVSCTINNITEYGLICTLETGIRGVIVLEQLKKPVSTYSENDTVKAAIIRIDVENCCVELSLLSDLIQRLSGSAKNDILKSIHVDQRMKAVVILNKADIILVSLLDHGQGSLAYLPGRLHYNDVREHKRRNVGDHIHVIIKDKFSISPNTVAILGQDASNEKLYALDVLKGRKTSRQSAESSDIVNPLKHIVSVKVGIIYDGYITNISEENEFYYNVFVNKSQLCRVHLTELTDNFADGHNLMTDDHYKPGRPVRIRVMEFRRTKLDGKIRAAECSAKISKLFCKNSKRRNLGYKTDFKRGDVVPAVVTCFKNDLFEFIINPDWHGFAHCSDLSEDLNVINNAKSHFQKGQIYHAFVTAVQAKEKRLVLSLLSSNQRALAAGNLCVGKIISINPGNSLKIVLSDGIKAVCSVTDLADDYDEVPSILSALKLGSYVKAIPVALGSGHRWRLTMRSSGLPNGEADGDKKDPCLESAASLKIGDILRGFVRKIAPKGFLVTLGYGISGRLPMPDAKRSNVHIGMLITVEVASLDKRKIMLHLIDSDVYAAGGKRLRRADRKAGDVKRQKMTDSEPDSHSNHLIEAGFDWSSGKFSMKNLIQVGLTTEKESEAAAPDAVENDAESSGWENEDNESDNETSKTKRKKIKAKHKNTENDLLSKEMSLLNPDRPLENEEDFDRLLMGSPNNSYLWLRYMALFVQSDEVSKARLVAERALKTIDLRQEAERFNIWTAMLNLENTCGSSESLIQVFERARQVNEPLKVYKQLLKIYQRSEKVKEADQLIEELLKKFKSDFDAWISAGEHFYGFNPKRPDLARQLTSRAAKSLPEDRKIDLASRFAQMEFKFADSERGKTLFESLVDQFPKRMDLWSVYADMVTKYRNPDEARFIYERVVSLKLPVNKIKSFYQKWLDFESRYGTEESKLTVQARLDSLLNGKLKINENSS